MLNRLFLAVLLMAGLSACVSVEGVGPGPYTYNKKVTVDLGKTWTAWPRDGRTDMQALSIDGVALNELLFADEIRDGDSLIYIQAREKIVPKFRSDMSAPEIAEFVADSLSYASYQNVETQNLRPDDFGSVDGLRFDLKADTTAGLNMLGTAKAGVRAGELLLILYLAPAEYYYDLHEAEVERILASVRLP